MISNMYGAEASVANNDQFEQALPTKHNDLFLKMIIKSKKSFLSRTIFQHQNLLDSN